MLFLTQKQLQKGKLKTKLRLNPASVITYLMYGEISSNDHFSFVLNNSSNLKLKSKQIHIYFIW